MLNYILLLKNDISNSEVTLVSGIPNSCARSHSTAITTYNDILPVRIHVEDTEMKLHWAGKTISKENGKQTIEGGLMYFTNE